MLEIRTHSPLAVARQLAAARKFLVVVQLSAGGLSAAYLAGLGVAQAQMIENIPREEPKPEKPSTRPEEDAPDVNRGEDATRDADAKQDDAKRKDDTKQETKVEGPSRKKGDGERAKDEQKRREPPQAPPARTPPATKKSNAGDPTSGRKRVDPGCQGQCPPPVRDVRRDDDRRRRNKTVPTRPRPTVRAKSSQGRGTVVPVRGVVTVSPHLTIADEHLASVGNRLGGGIDGLLALGPVDWPLLGGIQLGFDDFGGPTETFTFNGITRDHDVNLWAFWLHGLLRVQPARGAIRPYLDVFAGLWSLHATVNDPGELGSSVDDRTIGSDITGQYGIGAGVHWVLPNGLTLGLGGMYMRGGPVTLPNVNDIVVIDDVLYHGEGSLGQISQGLILLQIGLTQDEPRR